MYHDYTACEHNSLNLLLLLLDNYSQPYQIESNSDLLGPKEPCCPEAPVHLVSIFHVLDSQILFHLCDSLYFLCISITALLGGACELKKNSLPNDRLTVTCAYDRKELELTMPHVAAHTPCIHQAF